MDELTIDPKSTEACRIRAVAARVKVVKKDMPEHDAAQAQMRVEISLLRLLAAKHPRIVRELVDVLVK